MTRKISPSIALAVMLLSPAAFAQQNADAGKAAPASNTVDKSTVKADSVTINMPEGMTRDQADAILNELKQIRQLLENQQSAAQAKVAAAPSPAPVSDKVKMAVGQGWHVLGRADAPVTMVEFNDYQCPFCRRFEADTFPQLKENFIDTGKVRFVVRDLPLDIHPNALPASEAVHCAAEQNKFWQMHDAIMQDTATDLSADAILKYGEKVNLDMTAFTACITAKKFAADIQKDTSEANALGISGTPSFVIGKSASDQIDGVRVVGAVPYSVFESAINDKLPPK